MNSMLNQKLIDCLESLCAWRKGFKEGNIGEGIRLLFKRSWLNSSLPVLTSLSGDTRGTVLPTFCPISGELPALGMLQ